MSVTAVELRAIITGFLIDIPKKSKLKINQSKLTTF